MYIKLKNGITYTATLRSNDIACSWGRDNFKLKVINIFNNEVTREIVTNTYKQLQVEMNKTAWNFSPAAIANIKVRFLKAIKPYIKED